MYHYARSYLILSKNHEVFQSKISIITSNISHFVVGIGINTSILIESFMFFNMILGELNRWLKRLIEGDVQNLKMVYGLFTVISSHFLQTV